MEPLAVLEQELKNFPAYLDSLRQQRGALGWPQGSGQYSFEVPAKPGYMYARAENGGQVTKVEAINMGVPRLADFPVMLTLLANNELAMTPDPTRALQFMGQAGSVMGLGVSPHTHRLGSGMEDVVEGRRIEPGLVHVHDGSLKVFIEPFFYTYNGIRKHWGGGTIDLTSNVPATTNKWAWVLVGIDPSDNTAAATTGDEQYVTMPLNPEQLASISFADKIPLAGVKVRNGQTAIVYERDFMDSRNWSTGGGAGLISLPIGLAEGGTGSDLSSEGPGVVVQDDIGDPLTVRALVAGDIPALGYMADAIVDTKSDLLALTPSAPSMGFATDTNEFYFWTGAAWYKSPFALFETNSADMGSGTDNNRLGYGAAYITDKTLHNTGLGYGVREQEGDIRIVPESDDPPVLEIFLRDTWNTILYDFVISEDYDLEHTPLETRIDVRSGNSNALGLNGLPIVQEYKVSMGAFPFPRYISGGTF